MFGLLEGGFAVSTTALLSGLLVLHLSDQLAAALSYVPPTLNNTAGSVAHQCTTCDTIDPQNNKRCYAPGTQNCVSNFFQHFVSFRLEL
jgi:hypothetical protein